VRPGRRLAGALVAVALLAGCAEKRPEVAAPVTPPPAPPAPAAPARADVFVVMPDESGRAGHAVVVQGGKEIVLDKPYAAARTGNGGRLEQGTFTAKDADAMFAKAMAAQPPAPIGIRLYFIEGKEEFTPESAQSLQVVLAEIKRRPAPDVVVVGHTDRVGTVPSNDRLSLQRAERVRQELIRIGIPADSISVAGRGEREPLVATEDGVAEPRNRRVEITVR
jgi:outer membrane protein OmpA-like peptidoglycan-associated protein